MSGNSAGSTSGGTRTPSSRPTPTATRCRSRRCWRRATRSPPTRSGRSSPPPGEYDAADSVVVRYRTRDGVGGVDAVVPLVTADGTALLVDRGWMATDNRAVEPEELPAPPAGEVTVTGWVRADGTGDSTEVVDRGTRAISSVAIGEALGREVFGGFVDLRSEDPPPAEPLEAAEPPDLGEGPHFFYGLQWWFFGVLALGGFGYLAWDERRNGPRGERRRRTAATDA
ncbi:SURF1 family protein [Nocardioides sp. TF02-7]|uniref:SURF1 family protein n=1 Tax=Nocardioides sp. TF02-7 TaxID=2917724 RepID=UPI001F063E33|nr:SURF1 family protein [Nocardioides sp. TF02-7]UMG92438.1 SURF1 family protein [Nocardioides sp. TF02-7]